MTDAETDPVAAIAAALASLRGRRGGGPRPGWRDRAGFAGEGAGGPHSHEGPHGRGHGQGRGAPQHGAPFGRGGGERPPWASDHGRVGDLARLRLLDALAAAAAPLSVSEIGESIDVDQPRASRLVQQCVERGLVRREADPDDARRTRIVLTDEGRTFVRSIRGARRESIETALAEFSDQERAELARLLAKLAAAWPR